MKRVLLVATTGVGLLFSGARTKHVPKELARIAAGQAAVLGAVSLYYSAIGRISKIYLLDTALEALLISAWFAIESGAVEISELSFEKDLPPAEGARTIPA